MDPAIADNRHAAYGEFYRVFAQTGLAQRSSDIALARNNECTVKMNSALPADFAAVVAHATHSLSRQDIDFYFPSETEDINLPVVNPDLLSETEVLSKPFEFEHAFKTPALRVVDQVLSHMNFPDYDIRGNSAIERIVHEAHMQDWWSEGSKFYLELQKSQNLVDDHLCFCIRDVENNGIMANLRILAKKTRGSDLSNTGDRRHQKIMVYRFNYKWSIPYKFRFKDQDQHKYLHESEDIQSGDRRARNSQSRTYAEKSLRGDDESLDESEDIAALESPEAWKIWKNMLLINQPKMQEFGRQLAVYMHCMLQ